MRYKNIKTGAIINSSCKIKGDNWVVYEKEEIKDTTEIEETEKEVKNEEVEHEEKETIEGVTKKQIMQELDAMGIKYNPRDKKEILYNLMLGK